LDYTTTIIVTLAKHYSYPIWQELDPISILHLYCQTLNDEWHNTYLKMSVMGKPKGSDDQELDYEPMWL
jgi:hypothetical protein